MLHYCLFCVTGVDCLKAQGVFVGVHSFVWWLTECEG